MLSKVAKSKKKWAGNGAGKEPEMGLKMSRIYQGLSHVRVILLQIFNRTINATQQNSTFLGSKVEHLPIYWGGAVLRARLWWLCFMSCVEYCELNALLFLGNDVFGCNSLNLLYSCLVLCLSWGKALNWGKWSGGRRIRRGSRGDL